MLIPTQIKLRKGTVDVGLELGATGPLWYCYSLQYSK